MPVHNYTVYGTYRYLYKNNVKGTTSTAQKDLRIKDNLFMLKTQKLDSIA
jgi:hypothetical protein